MLNQNLISLSFGKILDIAVDIRKDSETYGKYFSYVLSPKNMNHYLFQKDLLMDI